MTRNRRRKSKWTGNHKQHCDKYQLKKTRFHIYCTWNYIMSMYTCIYSMLKVTISAKQCQFRMSYLLKILLFTVVLLHTDFFLSFYFTCAERSIELFWKNSFSYFIFFSWTTRPLSTKLGTKAPLGDGLPSFFNEGICYLARWNNY